MYLCGYNNYGLHMFILLLSISCRGYVALFCDWLLFTATMNFLSNDQNYKINATKNPTLQSLRELKLFSSKFPLAIVIMMMVLRTIIEANSINISSISPKK